MKEIVRLLLATWYLLGQLAHVYLGISIPDTYLSPRASCPLQDGSKSFLPQWESQL